MNLPVKFIPFYMSRQKRDMPTGKERVLKDLKSLEVMAEELAPYLDSKTLFGPTMYPDLPPVTLGGFLMRRHRLMALREVLLTETEQARLDKVLAVFDQVLREKGFQFKEKAQRELEVRVHQWDEHLKEMAENNGNGTLYYPTVVKPRVMTEDLVRGLTALSSPPDPYLLQQVEQLDHELRRHWQAGKFVWPVEWQPAYPQTRYWWLYGQPVFA